MTTSESPRLRREPPRFRVVEVRRREELSPRLVRVTVGGAELAGLTVDLPAASVRLLLPSPGSDELVLPTWNGNEFLQEDGSRPVIRTMTPRRLDPDAQELDLDVVLHAHGPAARWGATAPVGSPAAISGPGRGYEIDTGAPAYLLAGDECAIPAISQLLEVLPRETPTRVFIEVADPAARLALPPHPAASVTWLTADAGGAPGAALEQAVHEHELEPGTHVWAAGEAASMQRLRRLLLEERGLPRSDATIRGYWKIGRGGDSGSD